jgi:hypothetical protein
MTEKEDLKLLNKLLESTGLVLTTPLSIHIESSERIDELFKKIQEDYRKFKEIPWADEIRLLVDQDVHTQFLMAFLVLSYCAKKNKQILPPTTLHFSDKELEVYDLLKKYELLNTYSPIELRKKLISGDESIEPFFKEYMGIKQSLNQLVSHEEIRPSIRQYLKKQGDIYDKKFETAFGSDGAQFIVTTSDVQQIELNFINRIEYKLTFNGNCINFLDRTFTVDKIVKGNNSNSDDSNKFGIKKNLRKNQYIMAVFTEKSLSGKLLLKKSITFYAVFASHNEQYSEYGFDSKPLESKAINGFLEAIIKNPNENNNHILICIASPTGFENNGHWSSDNKLLNGYKSSKVSVCFFDLHNNEKFFNKMDKTSIELSKLCDLETEDEKYLKLKEILYPEMDHQLRLTPSVPLKYCIEFSKNHECMNVIIVKKIFDQYAKEKKLLVKDIPPIGPVIIIKKQ